MIRQASLADVESISILIYQAWQKDLIDLIALEAIDCLSVEKLAAKLKQDISNNSETVIVCEIGGEIAGYASGNVKGNVFDSEITGLYVNPKAQQSGVGFRLFNEMRSQFKSRYKLNMVVWTLLNAPNNNFYLKYCPIKTAHRDIIIADIKHCGVGFVYSL